MSPTLHAARRLPTSPAAILLDVGDTLVRPDPSWRDVYAGVFMDHGIDATSEQFEAAFRAAWKEWEQEGPFEATEEASFARLMALDRLVFARLGYPDLPESFFRQVDQAFRQRSAFYVFPDVIPALDALQAAGLRLAVVSNWGWAAPELLQTLELARHFEVLSISARVGYQKPHPAIFEHALELLGLAADEVVHVGDDPTADILGADRAGIAAVLIDRRGRLDTPIGAGATIDGVPIIADLAELLDLLGIDRPAALGGIARLSPARQRVDLAQAAEGSEAGAPVAERVAALHRDPAPGVGPCEPPLAAGAVPSSPLDGALAGRA